MAGVPLLGWPPLVGTTQQSTEQWCHRQGGEFERRRGRGGTCGEDVYSLLLTANSASEKIKIERATGSWISMASAGWGDATTNQKLAEMMGNIFGRWRAGR